MISVVRLHVLFQNEMSWPPKLTIFSLGMKIASELSNRHYFKLVSSLLLGDYKIIGGLQKVMITINKSSQNAVTVNRIDEVHKNRIDEIRTLGLIKQFLCSYFLPVLLLFVFIGMSWGTAAAQNRAYVTNIFTDTVSVIDTVTNSELTTIPVGSRPIAVAVTPNGTRAYVANQNASSVSVINTFSNTVIETISVGLGPSGVAITPNGASIYVTNQGHHTVSVIDNSSLSVTATINVGFAPFGIAISPDGTRAYVTNLISNSVSVINTTTNAVTTIPVGTRPFAVAFNAAGTRAYVANSSSDNVSVIDTATNMVIATIAVGDAPIALAVTPNGSRVYVANQSSHNVSVINTSNNTVTTIPVGFFPSGVAITLDGSRVYVTNQGSGNVSVIDTATNTVIFIIPTTGSCPFGIAITEGLEGGVTASGVSVGGSITTARGRGISKTYVMLSGGGLKEPVYAMTNPFGYYKFEDIPAGQTYIISVIAKRYRFTEPTRALSINDSIAGVDFVAEP